MPNNLPTEIKIGPYHYQILSDINRWAKIRYDSGSASRVGQIEYPTLTIDIDPNLAYDMAASSLLHEVIHGCIQYALHGRTNEQNDQDEIYAMALEGPLLEVLRDNPTLVAYLVNSGES